MKKSLWKKALSVAMAIVMIVSISSVSIGALAIPTNSVTLSSATGAPGDSVSVTIAAHVSSAVAGSIVDVVYDASKLTYDGFELNDGYYPTRTGDEVTDMFENGLHFARLYSDWTASPQTLDGNLCTLSFTIKADATSGEASIYFPADQTSIDSMAVDSEGEYIPVTPSTGSTITVEGPPPAPTYGISIAPDTEKVFTAEVAGYLAPTPHLVTVTNTGNQATGALTVALGGANANSFTLSKTAIDSIAASGIDNFTVTPKTELAVGTYSATVTVSGGENITAKSFNVSFTVNEAPTYGISLSPAANKIFAEAIEEYSPVAAHTVTVSNTGNQATGALTVALGGTDASSFVLNKSAISSIAVSGTDTFTVTPASGLEDKTYIATVTVSGENGISESFDVSFTVTPIPEYAISLTPGTVTCTSATVGYGEQSAATISMTNAGANDTGELTVALGGADADAFALSDTTLANTSHGSSANFTVKPVTGLAVKTYTATVTVSNANVPAETVDISFTVNAVPTPSYDDSGSSTPSTPVVKENYNVVTSDSNFATVSIKDSVDASKADKLVATYTDKNGTTHIIPGGHYDKATGKFVCTLPAGLKDVKVVVKTAANKTPASVATDHWGYDALSFLYDRDILTSGSLDPDKAVTRNDIVKYLAKATVGLDLSKYSTTSTHFKDVTGGTGYEAFLNWGFEKGIVNGYEDGTFRGDTYVSREEVSAVFVRFINFYTAFKTDGGEDTSFGDEGTIADWSKDYVHALTDKGLIKGAPGADGKNVFMPQSNLTNAEIATIIQRILAA